VGYSPWHHETDGHDLATKLQQTNDLKTGSKRILENNLEINENETKTQQVIVCSRSTAKGEIM